MSRPKVSVIVPVYNGAAYIGEAIQSVLDQTFEDFELIVISDASPDDSGKVVKSFCDSRIKYIEQMENRGANAARNTGTRVSNGEILVFLDQDDVFHPDKLKAHVNFLNQNPRVSLSYNGRFQLLTHSSKVIRDLWRPPKNVTLADMVLGFPFGPSEMVIRRDWLCRAGMWDETTIAGGEIDLDGRLWFDGCKFGLVDRALTFRRPHAGKLGRLSRMCNDEIHAREIVFNDPRCPEEVKALRDNAFTQAYLDYGYHALAQEETGLAQDLIRSAVRLSPALVTGKPCELTEFLTRCSVMYESFELDGLLRTIFDQLPTELARLSEQLDWALARGHLLKGVYEVIWGRLEGGRRHFERAKSLAAGVDERFLQWLTQKLLDYEAEFGDEATEIVLNTLTPCLEMLAGPGPARWLRGNYWANRALGSHALARYEKVPRMVARAITSNPTLVTNRGMLSVLLRSALAETPLMRYRTALTSGKQRPYTA